MVNIERTKIINRFWGFMSGIIAVTSSIAIIFDKITIFNGEETIKYMPVAFLALGILLIGITYHWANERSRISTVWTIIGWMAIIICIEAYTKSEDILMIEEPGNIPTALFYAGSLIFMYMIFYHISSILPE